MVRYSKLEFRSLTRKYGADLCFTPMIVSNPFMRSEKARAVEFSTNVYDTPIIVQFAANNNTDFLYATQLIQPYADGVDLNCGCPQSWAKKEGYGCYLLRNTEIIEDMMKTVRRNTPSDFSVSLKIRLLDKSIKSTISLCQQLESLNVSFITVHGRTPSEKSNADFPVNIEAIAEIKKSLKIPVIFNGDVMSLSDADRYYEATKCDGFMSARGILANPALYAGYETTPLSCIQDWLDISKRQKENVMSYQTFHHHFVFMMENLVDRTGVKIFNNIRGKRAGVYKFFKETFSMEPEDIEFPKNIECHFDDSKYKALIKDDNFWASEYSSESSHGKFFLGKMHKLNTVPDDYLDLMDDANNLLFQ